MKWSVSRKIALMAGVLIVTASVALSLTAGYMSEAALMEQTNNSMQQYAKGSAAFVGAKVEKNLAVLNQLAEHPVITSMDWSQQRDLLLFELDELGYSTIAIAQPDGTMINAGTGESANVSERQYFKEVMQGKSVASDVVVNKVTNRPCVVEAVPIRINGSVAGVLMGARDVEYLSELTDGIGLGKKGYGFILGADGTYYAYPDRQVVADQINVFKDLNDGANSFGAKYEALGVGNTGVLEYELDGEARLSALTPVPGTGWTLGIANYRAEVVEGVSALKLSIVIITIVVSILGVLCAWFVGRQISKPIKNLKAAADQLALGDVEISLSVSTRDEIGELMTSFGTMADHIKDQALAAERIAKGDLTAELDPRSEKDVLALSMKSVIETLRALVSETRGLTESAAEGNLEARGNAEAFDGGFREIIEGVNRTLDGIVEPLSVALGYISKMADGENMELMENQYKGEYGKLIENLNQVRDTLYSLTSEAMGLAQATKRGNLSHRADVGRLRGGYARIMQGMNDSLDAVVNPLRIAAGYMEQIGRGEVPETINETYAGELEEIKNSINACIEGLDGLVKNRDILMGMSVNDYSQTASEEYQGIYADISRSINAASGLINRLVLVMRRVADGDLSDLERLRGMGRLSERDELMPAVITMMGAIQSLVDETSSLSDAAVEGRLENRGDASRFSGQYRSVVEGINQTLDAILSPITEASSVLEEMARGNLQVVVSGDYRGDHAKLKDNLNRTLGSLQDYVSEITRILSGVSEGNLDLTLEADYRGDFTEIKNSLNNIIVTLSQVMGDINTAAEQVASGSRQVSVGSQSLSQGSTEQASTVQQLTASISELASQTKKNAMDANEASQLAVTASEQASDGNRQMREMLSSMEAINESSANISKIIKVIDDIAFQTNILALNAAVEAARAGQHGKGFAVVAEEVRNLAARSAAAARETTDLIEGSVQKAQSGTKIANETATSLNVIVGGIEQAADLVRSIAEASNEQASGIAQINRGIEQVSLVVQNNSATAEESAAASEELSGQAELLKEMMSRFKINKNLAALGNSESIHADIALQPPVKEERITKIPVISLAEHELDKY
ncbi:HAMP domain-containing protein [Anoxybacterium hadale]|uniref:HAMP domain-containing protein n=1 Tax=Anoxybacterium hadale TaxID=3408580 RepID=A0ACD1ACC5_9FIRM|nr:HAMP domain-containing protein [Clostridiales bacterium]